MTAPSAGAFTVFPQGPGQTPDNLTGLANNTALGLGIVGSGSVDAKDYKIGCVGITTGTVSAVRPTSSLYLAISEDGINFTDKLSPNSTNGPQEVTKFSQSQSLASMLVQQILCPQSNTQYFFNAFSILQKLGYVPTFFGLYVANNTGGTLGTTASGFIAGYKLITFN